MTDNRPPPDRAPTLRVVPMPADANPAGDIFGGWIVSQADIAGAIAAVRRARGRVVTVAINAFQFSKPVFIGDVVSFYAEVVRVGTTSITVDVAVYVERGPLHGRVDVEPIKVTEATLTYVAMDDERRPRPVPPVEGEYV